MKAIAVGEEHELFADQYALAFFLSQSQENTAKKVIAFNRTSVSESDFHYHPEELQAFYDAFPKPGSKELSQLENTYDLVALTIKVAARRSEGRRVGKECVGTCRSRGSADH